MKIYPPEKLSNNNVSDADFGQWKQELKVFLQSEKTFRKFIRGQYKEWEPYSKNNDRISALLESDKVNDLEELQIDLDSFITTVAR